MPFGEGMLQGIGDDLVRHQPERHRHVNHHVRLLDIAGQRHASSRQADEVPGQTVEEAADVHAAEVLGAVELFLERAERLDAPPEVADLLAVALALQGLFRHAQQADHHLEIVIQPMVQLLQDELAVLAVVAEFLVAVMSRAHSRGEAAELMDALDHVVVESLPNGPDGELLVARAGEHQGAAVRVGRLDPVEDRKAVSPAQVKVSDENIRRAVAQGPFEGREAGGFADLCIRELLEDGADCQRTDVRIIVDEQDVHGTKLTENGTGRGASGTRANAEARPLILSGNSLAAHSLRGDRDRGTRSHEPSRRGPTLGTVAFLIAALLLLTSAVSLNLFLGRVAENRAFVLRTSSILRTMAELNVDVRAAETGQRGFILSGERRYLAPYETAIQRVWAEFHDLEGAVRDPSQIARLHRLRPLIEEKLAELANTVELREQGFEAALAVVRTDIGQKLMEDIQAVVDEFERAEQEIMISRSQLLEDQAQWAARISALTAVLALAVTAVGVLWLARQRADARVLAAERGFRQDLEGQVERRTEQLTQVNRELDAFAYTISHDLRAPLRAMHGYADALAEDYAPNLPEEGRRFTHRIMAAAERMEALIQDILTYSRMTREEVRVRPVSLDKTADRVLAHARPRIEETGAVIEVGRPLGTVSAHPAALELVLDNLIANAVKFVAPGQTPHVHIRSENRGHWVRLRVEDNGIGIDPSHRERIFEPFQRLHGIETYPGTGIGLAIVRRGLERMGGQCGVDAEAGRGSRFWIELRRADGEVAQ